jgi:hypothetical protein
MAADLYFTEYWQSARHFRPAALASPNPLTKYYWLIYKNVYFQNRMASICCCVAQGSQVSTMASRVV